MDAAYLLKRRADTIARHELLESVPGSGYHPDDDQARSEERKKRKPLSKRPVVIQHDGTNWLCGPDVTAIRTVLATWVAKVRSDYEQHKAAAEAAGVEPSQPAPQAKQAEKIAGRVVGESGNVIELPNNEWNAILFGLESSGIQVVAVGVLP